MKYMVEGVLEISIWTEVEADGPDDAMARAASFPVQGLCHQCTDEKPQGQWITEGELDGRPKPTDAIAY